MEKVYERSLVAMAATLSLQEKERFYRIWFVLLHWVNEQLHLVPWLPAVPPLGSVEPEQAIQVRNALWADDRLLTSFLAENPAHLSREDLALIESWQHRISGNFFVLRALKNYTVLLTEEAHAHAYGVVGLTDSVAETMIMPLPVYIQTVLLPFEDRIIYDGLLTTYSVFFGPGIRSSLNEAYRNAKEREGIITSLRPSTLATSPDEQRSQVQPRNEKLLQAFRKHLAQTGLSIKMMEQHTETIRDFASTMLLSQTPPRGLLELTPAEVEAYLQTTRVKTAATSFKRFVRFLMETGRVEYELAEEVRQRLK